MAESTSGADKRRAPRVGAPKISVRIPSADRFRSHYLKDLSEGGLFIRANKVLPEGTELLIDLWPPDEDSPLSLPARIVRATDAASVRLGQEPGMAVAFQQVAPDVAVRLRELIERHGHSVPPPVADDDPVGRVQQMVAELEEARSQLGQLGSELADARGERQAYAEQLPRLEQEAQTLRARMLEANAVKAQAEQARAQAEQARTQLEAENKRLREEVSQLKLALEAAKANPESNALRQKFAELSVELEAARTRERTLAKVLSGSPRPAAAAAKPRGGKAKPPPEEIFVDVPPAPPVESAIDSIDLALDAMQIGHEEPSKGAISFKDEPMFANQDIEDATDDMVESPADEDLLSDFLGGEEKTDAPLSVAPDSWPAEPAGGLAGFVLEASIGEGRKTYEDFAKALIRTTRLMPSPGLAKRKPTNVDEALLIEMIAAAPTFGTLISQMGAQVKEERLKQMVYELYARELVDLRDY